MARSLPSPPPVSDQDRAALLLSVAASAPQLSAPHARTALASPLNSATSVSASSSDNTEAAAATVNDDESLRTDATISRAHTPAGSESCATTSRSSASSSSAGSDVAPRCESARESDSVRGSESERDASLAQSLADSSGAGAVQIGYRPDSHRIFVLLDLDKTLFLSDADAREDQRFAFVGDFEINGYMAITNERFAHRMMLRPGAHWFLRRVLAIAEVYVITAGDLHYARAAVRLANERHWVSSKDPTTDQEPEVAAVYVWLFRLARIALLFYFSSPFFRQFHSTDTRIFGSQSRQARGPQDIGARSSVCAAHAQRRRLCGARGRWCVLYIFIFAFFFFFFLMFLPTHIHLAYSPCILLVEQMIREHGIRIVGTT